MLKFFPEIHRRREAGFSIVQGMVLTAVFAASALVLVDYVRDQKLMVKGAETRESIEQLHEVIFGILQYRDSCEATVRGNNVIVGNVVPNNVALPLDTISYASGVDAAGNIESSEMFRDFDFAGNPNLEGTYMNGQVSIEDMSLTFPDTPPNTPLNPAVLTISYQRLNSSAARRTKKGYGGKDLRKVINIVFQKDKSDNFLSCYAVNTSVNALISNQDLAQEFCESMGLDNADPALTDKLLVWDQERNICTFQERTCPDGSLFVGIRNTGETMCEQLGNWGFGTLIDSTVDSNCAPAQRTNVRFVDTGSGQVRIRCSP